MRLLSVEDNSANAALYQQLINDFNSSGGEQIELSVVNTLDDALEIIKKQHFDGAIVDLKLSADTQSETEGNEVLKEIVGKKRFPVFVYSSFLGDIDPTISESIFFQKFDRTALAFLEVVRELLAIYTTGVTKILGQGGTIENHLTGIFWKHIAESFEELKQKGIAEDQLLRYIAGHLYEYLEVGEDAGTFSKYFPEEVYIKPSIKQGFFTGSIVKEKTTERVFIILSPACDMAQGKAEKILIAELSSLTEFPVKQLKIDANKVIPTGLTAAVRKQKQEKKERAAKNLEDLLRNNYSQKYYFLPKSKCFNGGLINFQNLESVDKNLMSTRFDIIATISTHFLKDIVAKFSYYYARQGAPEVNFLVSDLP
jgi:CheY-like chemotaxis protein